MKKILIAVLMLSLTFAGTVVAGNDKVGLCHRTGSDTNPYVFIRVSVKAAETGQGLSDHLGNNDKGHKEIAWKTHGTWRGVIHRPGDTKDDYLANFASHCEDFVPEPTDTPKPTGTPGPTATPTATPAPTETPVPTDSPVPSTQPTPSETISPTPSPVGPGFTLPPTDTE